MSEPAPTPIARRSALGPTVLVLLAIAGVLFLIAQIWTEVLWFERIAPVSWYVANHVKEGRAALNFSEWSTNAGEEADDAGEAVDEGGMPLSSYTSFGLHGDAKLSPAEVRALVDGLERTIAADPPAGGEG